MNHNKQKRKMEILESIRFIDEFIDKFDRKYKLSFFIIS